MLSTRTIVIAGAGIATAAGLALLGASFAGADQVSPTTAAYGYGRGAAPGGEGGRAGEVAIGNGNTDPSKPMRSDEQLLTGETADKVTAAAKAMEPTTMTRPSIPRPINKRRSFLDIGFLRCGHGPQVAP